MINPNEVLGFTPPADETPTVTADQIKRRYPQLSDEIVQFCLAQKLGIDDIGGALYMAQRRRHNHRQAMAVSNQWTPPSTRPRKASRKR